MPFFVLAGLALLVVAVLGVRAFVETDVTSLRHGLGWFALGLFGAISAALFGLFIASERLGLALILLAVDLAIILGGRKAWRQWRAGSIAQQAAAPQPPAGYLERLLNRSGARPEGQATALWPSLETMTRAEALAVLGLAPGATAAEVKRAHQVLMAKLDPDHGGSDYLAAKVERAKDILLQRRSERLGR